MTGREWLNPDANSASRHQQHNNNRRKKQSRGRFKDDRARRYSNPRYAGKQDRNTTPVKQERNFKKLHQQESNSLNDTFIKRRDSLTRKLQAKNSLSSPVKVTSDKPVDPSIQAEMGFCGNVKADMVFGIGCSKEAKLCSDASLSTIQQMDTDDMLEAGCGISHRVKSQEDIGKEVDDLYNLLREYMQVEGKFLPEVMLPVRPQRGEVCAGARDGAVHVLRCLKVWYDLPTDVLFHAINLLDRFLSKMKVRPCHMSCISVSCMSIAISSHRPQLPTINIEDLVSISQCKCTVGDVRRMSGIIGDKLGSVCETVTALQWLRLMMSLFSYTSQFAYVPPESEIVNRLEILSCDASCCNIRPCELALVLLCTHLDSQLGEVRRSSGGSQNQERLSTLSTLVHSAMELKKICQITDKSFYSSQQAVVGVLDRYNARQKSPYRQRLVWKVSSRTLRVLRPTDRLTSFLPTITEQQNISNTTDARMRLGSESSEDAGEESQDWPTSPLVPVICSETS